MKEIPLFLIAHNKKSKNPEKFIVCTKKPAFIARVVKFQSKLEMEAYTKESNRPFERLLFRNEIIEIISIFTAENIPEKLYKRMVLWYLNYGEKEA